MASFGKMSRETPDQLPHYGRKLITAEILSHEKEQCSFSPSLPPDGVRDKIEKSSYGSGYVPPKKAEEVSPSRAELRAAFVPTTDVSEVSKILKQAVPSNRYGQKSVNGKTVYEARQKKMNELRPTPSFQPKVNRGRLESEIPSSGYSGTAYVPPVRKRGEAARKVDTVRRRSCMLGTPCTRNAHPRASGRRRSLSNAWLGSGMRTSNVELSRGVMDQTVMVRSADSLCALPCIPGTPSSPSSTASTPSNRSST
eukprot:m.69459 g.69459  ORF g.69459 m.69459 type:complete len:254 (+) comp18392_c0_seq2:261-1022(+)